MTIYICTSCADRTFGANWAGEPRECHSCGETYLIAADDDYGLECNGIVASGRDNSGTTYEIKTARG